MYKRDDAKDSTKPSNLAYQTDVVKEYRFKFTAGYRADRDLNLAVFKDMMTIFQKTADANGHLDMNGFITAFEGKIGLSVKELGQMFMKIDVNADGFLCWEEFSGFLLLQAEGEKLMAAEKVGEFTSQDWISKSPHKEMIVKVQYIKSVKKYMTCCRAGTIVFWTEAFKVSKIFPNAGQLQGEKKPHTRHSLKGSIKSSSIPSFQGTRFRWINAALYSESFQKIILASDDHQISIYDSSNMARIVSFDLEHHNALSLDYHPIKDTKNSMLVYTTDSGQVNIYTIDEEFLLQMSRKSIYVDTICIERDDLPTRHQLLGTMWKKKVHNDWGLEVIYVPDLRILISCSPDPRKSLSIGRYGNNHSWNFKHASVYKGISCVAFSPSPQIVVTAGLDKMIRIWNPLHKDLHPTAAFKGHSTAILKVVISSQSGLIFSLSVSKTIKIWDIRTLTLLQSIPNSVLQFPDDYLSCMLFNQDSLAIVTVSSSLKVYKLIGGKKVVTTSHEHPVRNILYNPVFGQLVSGCDGSAINVWDFETGEQIFKFEKAHDSYEVTAMCFEPLGRRLITGGRDGSVKIWNHNNGALLKELVLKDKTEVTAIKFLVLRKIPYIVVTGWDKRVSFFLDTNPEAYTVYPEYTWPSEEQLSRADYQWHEDDILSLEFLPPSLFASSSYSGDIIICNLNSGEILHHLNPHDFQPTDFPKSKRSIDKGIWSLKVVIFLENLSISSKVDLMVTVGGDGIIRLWNPQSGKMILEKEVLGLPGIYSLAGNASNDKLFVGDSNGMVSIFDISKLSKIDFSSDLNDKDIPCIKSFKAHASAITGVCVIDKLIITSSADCNVRAFAESGRFIGTFGQHRWDLSDFKTFAKRPKDIIPENVGISTVFNSNVVNNDKSTITKVKDASSSVDRKKSDGKVDVQSLQRWYTQSLYAKEKLLKRMPVPKYLPPAKPSRDALKIHKLDDIVLPNFKAYKNTLNLAS